MASFDVILEVEGIEITSEEHFDELSEATDDQALFASIAGRQYADITVQAASESEAIKQAKQRLLSAVAWVEIVGVEVEAG